MPKDLESAPSLPIMVKSLHFHQLFGKSLVINNPGSKDCKDKPAFVACSGSMKAKMTVSRDRCFGTVELLIKGLSHPICSDALNSIATQEVLCAELKCGKRLQSLEFFPPSPAPVYSVVTLNCLPDNKSLTSCTPTIDKRNCSHGRLKCSDWKRLVLKSKAGGGACEGVVFVYSEGDPVLVSSHGWTQAEGDILCKDLGCGGYQNHNEEDPDGLTTWGTFSCSGVNKPQNIWDCLLSEQAAVNGRNKRLYLKCQGHFNASLSEGCKGEVLLNNQPVLFHNWTLTEAHRICEETGCGNAFNVFESRGREAEVKAYQVGCLGPEERLGQCMISEGTYKRPLVSVICFNAFQFNTTEQCGGQIQVLNPDDEWEFVWPLRITNHKVNNHLCELLNCSKARNDIPQKSQNQVDLKMKLACSKDYTDIRYCVTTQARIKGIPAEIYCEGYVTPVTDKKTDLRLPLGLAAGGVILVLAVGLFFLLRHLVLRTGVSKRRDMEVDTSDYEDVGSSVNGKGSLSRMDSRSLPADIPWNDSDNASLSYDDIAEEGLGETLPLTKEKAPGEEHPEDNPKICYNDVAPTSTADNVSHGEDIQEDYDDVLVAECQVAEMSAEAYSGLRTPCREQVPMDDMEGDHDYLEQDHQG
ncbi:unnamed protein product [Lota lota]